MALNARSEVVVACSVVKWRTTADEDGHYCFAVALGCGSQMGTIVRLDLPNRLPILRFEVVSGSGF
jgi:hypothetical protein